MVSGCGGDKKAAEPQKTLKVGTEPTFAPFEFQKKVLRTLMVLIWI
jgi:polar amino acid transport system substrate-binding protein